MVYSSELSRATRICGPTLGTNLSLSATRSLHFVWVKSDGTKMHIDKGVTTALVKVGNDSDGADKDQDHCGRR